MQHSTPTTAVAKETNLAPPIKPGKECEADSPASSAYSVVTSSMGVNRDDLEKMMLQQKQKFFGMISQVMAHIDVYDKPASRSSTSLARYGGGRQQWESGDGGGTAIGTCGSYGKMNSNPHELQSGKPRTSRARDQQEASVKDRHPHIPPSPDPHVLQAPNPWTLHQVKHG